MTDEDIKAIRMLEFIVNHNSLLGYKPENREALAEYIINLIEKQQKELEKKDKIINEMAKSLEVVSKNNHIELDLEHGMNYTEKDIIEYFTKKVGE